MPLSVVCVWEGDYFAEKLSINFEFVKQNVLHHENQKSGKNLVSRIRESELHKTGTQVAFEKILTILYSLYIVIYFS